MDAYPTEKGRLARCNPSLGGCIHVTHGEFLGCSNDKTSYDQTHRHINK